AAKGIPLTGYFGLDTRPAPPKPRHGRQNRARPGGHFDSTPTIGTADTTGRERAPAKPLSVRATPPPHSGRMAPGPVAPASGRFQRRPRPPPRAIEEVPMKPRRATEPRRAATPRRRAAMLVLLAALAPLV